MKKTTLFFTVLLIFTTIITSFSFPVSADDDIVIVLDPGHGGDDYGTSGKLDGKTYYEKNLTRKVTEYLWNYLSQYNGVKVYLTNYDDQKISIQTRGQTAGDLKADLMISLHMNAVSGAPHAWGGTEIYVSKGTYRPEYARTTTAIGEKILKKFKAFGLADRGVKTRLTDETDSYYNYPNGGKSDYYGIIRYSLYEDVPAMIIEHGFMSSYNDLAFLSKDDNLKKLANATAESVAEYYHLSKGSGRKMVMKPQSKLTISDMPTTLSVGDEPVTLKATGGSGNGILRFESNDKEVLRIDGDKLIIVGPGKANITAVKGTDGEYQATKSSNYIRITVNDGPAHKTPVVNPATPTQTPTSTPTPAQNTSGSPSANVSSPSESTSDRTPSFISVTPDKSSSGSNKDKTIVIIGAIIGGIAAAIVISSLVRIAIVKSQKKNYRRH